LPGVSPRRFKLATEWQEPMHEPDDPGKDWVLILPFPGTFQNAFHEMTDISCWPHVSSSGRLCLYLKGVKADPDILKRARAWVATVGKYVGIRDCLTLSFALDYERENGNPDLKQTEVGALRARAKPYGRMPTRDTLTAGDVLVEKCLAFLKELTCYNSADAVVAMPGSSVNKPFDLPSYLAEKVASGWQRENLTKYVRTTQSRDSLKNKAANDKLATIRGTIEVDGKHLRGRTVLLIDDLYQSGISVNYCAMLLLQAGASMVLGLACEKTCRNDDNVSGDTRA